MKRIVLCAVLLGLLCIVSSPAEALTYKPVTNFSDWTADPWGNGIPVLLTPKGNTVAVKADGSGGETWGGLYKKAKNAVGMMATINVSKVVDSNNSANMQVGIMNSLGTINGKRIRASIYLNQWNGKRTIRWEVREKNDTTDTTRTLAVGYFGGWEGAWVPGKDITVSFRRAGNEILFSVNGIPSIMKWQSTTPMGHLDWSPELFGYAMTGQNTISATIKKVSIIYP